MSEDVPQYGEMNEQRARETAELIEALENALSGQQTAHHDRCLKSDNCKCDAYAKIVEAHIAH